MTEIRYYRDLEKLVKKARKNFKKNTRAQHKQIKEVFETTITLFKCLIGNKGKDALKDSKEEFAIVVLFQAIETINSLYLLSRDGYFDKSRILIRNICELLSVAIAIGYDNDCFVDWKNERLNNFNNINKRISNSIHVPKFDKERLRYIRKQWNLSSQKLSHYTSINSITVTIKNGKISAEPKCASRDFSQARARTVRNLLFNVGDILVGFINSEMKNKKSNPQTTKTAIKWEKLMDKNTEWNNEITG